MTIDAGENLTIESGANVIGVAKVVLNVDHYGSRGFVFPTPVDPDPGTGGTLTLNGRASASSVELWGHTDNDTFIVSANGFAESSNLTIDGWDGSDTATLDLTGATNAVLTRNSSSSAVLTFTRSGGGNETVTFRNVENINTTGVTPTVVDNVPPVWDTSLPSEIVIDGNTSTGANISNTDLQTALQSLVSDLDDNDLDFGGNPSTFPFGRTSVTFTATDDGGNAAQAPAVIDVVVNKPPFVVNVNNTVFTEDFGISYDDTSGLTDNIQVVGGVTLRSNSGDRGGVITIEAGDDLILDAGSQLQAGTRIELNVDYYGDLDVLFPVPTDPDPGVGGIATLNGQLIAPTVIVNGLTDGDTFNLSPVSFESSLLTINGHDGTDTLNVDLTGVTNPILNRTGATSATITSASHRTITINDVENIVASAGVFAGSNISPVAGAYTIKSDGSGNLIFQDAAGSFVIQPLTSTDPVSIVGSGGDDQLTVDHSVDGLPIMIDFSGGGGTNTLSIIGEGTYKANYMPDAATSGSAMVYVANSDFSFFSEVISTGVNEIDLSGMGEGITEFFRRASRTM